MSAGLTLVAIDVAETIESLLGSTSAGPTSSTVLGRLAVPNADDTGNDTLGRVVGSKNDLAQTTLGSTRSLMGYAKGNLQLARHLLYDDVEAASIGARSLADLLRAIERRAADDTVANTLAYHASQARQRAASSDDKLTAARLGYIDGLATTNSRVDAAVSSRASQGSVDNVYAETKYIANTAWSNAESLGQKIANLNDSRLTAARAGYLDYLYATSAIGGAAGSIGQRLGYLVDYDARGGASTSIGGMLNSLEGKLTAARASALSKLVDESVASPAAGSIGEMATFLVDQSVNGIAVADSIGDYAKRAAENAASAYSASRRATTPLVGYHTCTNTSYETALSISGQGILRKLYAQGGGGETTWIRVSVDGQAYRYLELPSGWYAAAMPSKTSEGAYPLSIEIARSNNSAATCDIEFETSLVIQTRVTSGGTYIHYAGQYR